LHAIHCKGCTVRKLYRSENFGPYRNEKIADESSSLIDLDQHRHARDKPLQLAFANSFGSMTGTSSPENWCVILIVAARIEIIDQGGKSDIDSLGNCLADARVRV